MMCVLEPMWTGIGGDCFAIVWDGKKATGLDAAGPASRRATASETIAIRGPSSVTVPGAVAGWDALLKRFGTRQLGNCLQPAIDIAESGYPVSPIVAWHWRAHGAPDKLMPVPPAGQPFPMPALAGTLRKIAKAGPSAFYEGEIAESVCRASTLHLEDLEAYAPRWVQPLSATYRGIGVLQMPPPTQGVAVLEALKLLEGFEKPTIEAQISAMQLALQDARRCVRDGAEVAHLLEDAYIERRRRACENTASEPASGTIYICVVDASGLAVSFIQSLYMPFGSKVVTDTGILLQNRGACFSVNGAIIPGARPYHTTIPALCLRGGRFYGAFGVVGGFIQAQAHLQVLSNIIDQACDPQEALDRPRFFIDGDCIRLEKGLWEKVDALTRMGISCVKHDQRFDFGAGQAIFAQDGVLVGGSDSRKDGVACGY
jgi:gamma-glutamyltranspeptidase / glutathione hydrolase